jgi:hypothetical protein
MNRSDIQIPSPCSNDWNTMTRAGRKRFCTDCQKHVHDLSAMSRAEAEVLLQSGPEGSLCVRYIYDQYGSIMFDMVNPSLVPAARLKRQSFERGVVAAAALTFASSLAGCMGGYLPPPQPAAAQPAAAQPTSFQAPPHPQGATAGMPLPLPPAKPSAEPRP